MENQPKKITIAIDGYSSCGKSTMAKALAKELNYIFIDSGAMYRAITLFFFENGLIDENQIDKKNIIKTLPHINLRFEYNPLSQKPEIMLNDENVESKIRSYQISQLVSKIAVIKEVREKLVAEQRKLGEQGGVVMDGRDIGSVVFPNAEVKFFVTADPKIRAQRRFLELNDPKVSIDQILENLMERDRIDSTREESPLIQAEDAIIIDNSNMNQEEQLNLALGLINSKINPNSIKK